MLRQQHVVERARRPGGRKRQPGLGQQGVVVALLEIAQQRGDGPAPASWALYRVVGPAAELVATGRAGVQVADPQPPKGPASYCLSALDRSGNEGPLSDPLTVSD